MQQHYLEVFSGSRWLRMLSKKPQQWGMAFHPYLNCSQRRPVYVILEPRDPLSALELMQGMIKNACYEFSVSPPILVIGDRDDNCGLTIGGWTLKKGELHREIFQIQIVALPPGSFVEHEFQAKSRDWEDVSPLVNGIDFLLK